MSVSNIPPAYPPPDHMLRDLAIFIERGEGFVRAGLEVTPALCSGPHGVRAGVLAPMAAPRSASPP